jgi:hypothetical protein
MADEVIVDIFSSMDHKVGMGPTEGGIDSAPEWLDDFQKRRINYVKRVRAYLETVARFYMPELADDDPSGDSPSDRREFNDPAIMARRIGTSVLGDDPTVGIVGSDDPVPEEPDLPPLPTEPRDDDPELLGAFRQRVYGELSNRWNQAAEEAFDEWVATLDRMPRLRAAEEWLQDWAKGARLIATLLEAETEHIVPVGWCPLVLGWDHKTRRVEVEIYEPETYFPVLDEYDLTSFPKTVHFAWTFLDKDDAGDEVEYVRRITYELVPAGQGELATEAEMEAVPDGVDLGEQPAYLTAEDTWEWSCLLSDATWLAEDFETVDMMENGTYAQSVIGDQVVELNIAPIGLDFMPVVMVPNDLTSTEHFGRSSLSGLYQLFDEIAATDSDESLSSRWAARPPTAVSDLPPGTASLNLTPGQAIGLGANGRVFTVDMAANLGEVGNRLARLLKRLSVNGQVPEGLLGRVDASEVPSGLALTLSFTPFHQLIERMRLAREHKYALLLKMVQRIAVQNADETFPNPDDIQEAELRFGSFMPQDLAGIAQIITALRSAHAISQETAIEMAQDGGAPIEDAREELLAIRRTMTAETYEIFMALGAQLAAEFMGVNAPPPVEPVDEQGAVQPPEGSETPEGGTDQAQPPAGP